MERAIENFNKQFNYRPEILNPSKLKESYDNYIVCGMGGSHLAAGLLKMHQPGINLYVHRDYDLPPYDEEFFKKSLLIASSYSGNTEEVISFIEEGYSRGFDVAVISTGGKLIKFAQENNIPYIQMPDEGIQPRNALGFSLMSMAMMIDKVECCTDLGKFAKILKPSEFEDYGRDLAKKIKDRIPVICTSTKNLPIAYNWKIKMNETGKIPAFYNLFPELNHNEMNGYDTEKYSDKFHFIFIKDEKDNTPVQKRMKITEEIYEAKGMPVTTIYAHGGTELEKALTSLLIADWTALYIAKGNDKNPEAVEMIEDFKGKMKN